MNYYDLLEEIIKEYFVNQDDDASRKKIVSLFYLFKDDISKSIALQMIINSLKNTSLFVELFDDILKYRKTFEERDVFFEALSKTDAIPVLLNKYKKASKILEKETLSSNELRYLDNLMYYIDVLKSFAYNDLLKAPTRKDKSYAKTKVIKRLKNVDLKYNKLLEKTNAKEIEDVEDYRGLLFHCRQIRGSLDFSFSTNDKKFIRYYLENINHLKCDFYIDLLIPYLLSYSPTIPFIREMQNLIKDKYQAYFKQIGLEQLELITKVNQFDFASINEYCRNAILTGEVININLANTLIKKHLLKEITITEEILFNCLKSIINEYAETFNLPNISLIIHKKGELGGTVGYTNELYEIIGIGEGSLDKFIFDRDVELINTLFHELTHAYQYKKIDNYDDYLIQKEFTISRYYQCFYDKNYARIYYEIGARSNGAIETIRYLNQLVPKVANEYEKKYIKGKQLENSFLSTASIKKSPYKEKYGVDSVDNIFDQLVKKHPQIVRRKEFFKLEYNLDGSRKTLKEMFDNYPNLKPNEKEILKTLLRKRDILKPHQEVIREIEEALEINSEISLYYLDLLVNKYSLKLGDDLLLNFINKHQSDLRFDSVINKFKMALIIKTKNISKQGLENTPKTR